MNYILFDNSHRNDLLPLTFTRPMADIRFGILTIREKWEHYLQCSISTLTEEYLQKQFPLKREKENILISASVCPTPELVEYITQLKPGDILSFGEEIIASYDCDTATDNENIIDFPSPILQIRNVYDIFAFNDQAIATDFALLTNGRKSQSLSDSNRVIGNGNKIFIEEGAKVECAILNTTDGYIYIGKDAEIMENSVIRGPFAMCEHAVVKMSAKIYGATTIGRYAKVGGELSNVVVFDYSNKAHDGFLGNSVIGSWCNIGADSNCSNLKNTYDKVRLWNYPQEAFVDTGLQFCGLIMGDHSKCGINTMFNTGTVVGVSTNLFGTGFPRNFVPSFAWGGAAGIKTYDVENAIIVAERMYARRHLVLSENEKNILRHIYNLTLHNRRL